MRTKQKQQIVSAAAELLRLKKARIAAEKREKHLKGFLERQLKKTHEDNMVVGKFLITLNERTRSGWDDDALAEHLGESFESFRLDSSYTFVDVKTLKGRR